MPFVTTWISQDYIMQSEISQKGLIEFWFAYLQFIQPNSWSMIVNIVATNHVLKLFKFNVNKIFSSLLALATFRCSVAWYLLVATIPGSTLNASIIAESSVAQHLLGTMQISQALFSMQFAL